MSGTELPMPVEGVAVEGERVRIFEDAFRKSDFEIDENLPEVVALGQGEACRWITTMLNNAGITLTCHAHAEEDALGGFEFLQIVSDEEMEERLQVDDLDNVELASKEKMLGFQLILDGDSSWKLQVDPEVRAHYSVSQRSGRSTANSAPLNVQNRSNHEVFVAHGVLSDDMRATVCTSGTMIVTVIFEVGNKANETVSKWDGGLPAIYQRRVDMVFHNEYIARVQVRSMFHVPCSRTLAHAPRRVSWNRPASSTCPHQTTSLNGLYRTFPAWIWTTRGTT